MNINKPGTIYCDAAALSSKVGLTSSCIKKTADIQYSTNTGKNGSLLYSTTMCHCWEMSVK